MANSHTLGTFSSPALGRADIEVPSEIVDGNSQISLACYPRSSFYPLSLTFLLRDLHLTNFVNIDEICEMQVFVIGSLSSAFASARLACLAVKPAYAFTQSGRFPSDP